MLPLQDQVSRLDLAVAELAQAAVDIGALRHGEQCLQPVFLEFAGRACDRPIAAQPDPLELPLQFARGDRGMGIAKRLDHSLEDAEQLDRRGLHCNFRPILLDDLVPVCMLQIEGDVMFGPGAAEHFEVVEWSVGSKPIAHRGHPRQPVDADVGRGAVDMQQPVIVGAVGPDEEHFAVRHLEGRLSPGGCNVGLPAREAAYARIRCHLVRFQRPPLNLKHVSIPLAAPDAIQ